MNSGALHSRYIRGTKLLMSNLSQEWKTSSRIVESKECRGNIALRVHKSVINLIIPEALLKNQVIKELLLFDAQVFGVQVFNSFFSAATVKLEIVL